MAIPILCGPEIAVPATKSFMNQITLFYYLAIKTAQMQLNEMDINLTAEQRNSRQREIDEYYSSLFKIPSLLKETLDNVSGEIDIMAGKMYMEPSIHILATKISGVAMEGALKIRETVLTHAEGREASEFKHGPNTILGKNTVFGVKHLRSLLRYFSEIIDELEALCKQEGIPYSETKEIYKALADYIFTHNQPFNLSLQGTKTFNKFVQDKDFFEHLYRNYPLVYFTGPDERDVNLTISQINSHKNNACQYLRYC